MLGAINAKGKEVREKQYKGLLLITGKTVGYAEKALLILEEFLLSDNVARMIQELNHYIGLPLSVPKADCLYFLRSNQMPTS